MLAGLATAMDRVGASEGVVGIKDKYQDVIALAAGRSCPRACGRLPLSDSYPAGDEFILVYDVTGRVIPPGGIPRDVGAVVMNVETLVNVARGRPVTDKFLTVAGAVKEPVTLRVPIGMTLGEVIAAAGGTTEPNVAVLLGGVMMGGPPRSLDEPVTKTTGGIVVLPATHPAGPPALRDAGAGRADRPRRLRPVQLLHGALPAVPARPPDRAAPGHAGRWASPARRTR